MVRDALVVGINSYTYKPLNGLRSPAVDAEAIAQMLSEYGDFRVRRLPEAQIGGVLRVGQSQKMQVSLAELEEELLKLFLPEGNEIPDTALLYFSGHGLRKGQGKLQEGFLATSDANPQLGLYGLSLQWLCRLLQASTVRQQIVWLDCCYSGELFNFKENLKEADPGNLGQGRDRCFIAASRAYEAAYAELGSDRSVLTAALLKGLDPQQHPGRWITNHTLADFLNQELKAVPQNPIYSNFGSPINLTRWWSKQLASAGLELTKICPYKGLEYFDCNEEDARYFYGRTALTDQLLEKVRQGNFLAVLGASGSGKSSVVRAGLLYQLKLGRKLSGSNKWLVYIFRPGEHPFGRLVEAFIEPELSVVDRAMQLAQLKKLIGSGAAEGLEYLVTAAPTERVVLVVDQFEETFTLCQNSKERQRFFECLLGALERTGNKLCLVLTMRADFLGKCAEQDYAGLAAKIQEHLVTVTPMKPKELQQAIAEPAKQVGLEIEPELVTQMMADVAGSPGSLPLLQYTLTQLWQQRAKEQLTLAAYTHLGGVKGTLQKRADEVYQSLQPAEQLAAKRIFLELTQLGEGTEDTRRQVFKQDLVTEQQSATIVEQVIQKLADAKLVVTSELVEKGSPTGRVAIVDVAHEALIRHWSTLRQWLEENRDRLRRQRQIEQATQLWQQHDRQADFLLSGVRLAEAEEIYHQYQDELPQDVQRFIQACLEEKRQQQQREKRRLRRAKITASVMSVLALAASSFGGLAYWQKQQAQLSEIAALNSSSEGLVSNNRHLDALFAGVKAGRLLQHTIGVSEQLESETASALQQVLSTIQESNRLEGHRGTITNLWFSPDGKTFASSGQDGTVRLWRFDGQLLATLDDKAGLVEFVSFSPDSKLLATSGWDGKLRIWQVDGKLLKTIKAHKIGFTGLSFSPDGKLVVSSGGDKTIKLWGIDGKLLKTLPASSDFGSSLSPDGKLIAAAAGVKDGTIQLWKLDGTLLHTLKGHSGVVNRLSFSPDGKILVSTGADAIVKLWDLNGTLLHTLKGHTNTISRVSFSPDGKTLASASLDETVKLWQLDGTLLKTLKGDGMMSGVSFSPDGKMLVAGSEKGTLKLWQVDGQLLKTIKGHRNWILSVKFSPDGKKLISADVDGTIKIWQLDDNVTFLKTIKGHSAGSGSFNFLNLFKQKIPQGVLSVKFSPNGKMLASVGADSIVKVWQPDGKLLGWLKVDGGVASLSFSPDSKILALTGLDGAIKLWRVDGRLLTIKQAFGTGIVASSVRFSPNGKMFASGMPHGIIKIWQVNSNSTLLQTTLLQTINPGYWDLENPDISFSLDSKLLTSTSSDGNIRLWQLDGKLRKIFPNKDGSYPIGVDFKSDGQTFTAIYNDGTLKYWQMDGTLIKIFKGPSEWMQVRSISPDRHLLISNGREDGTLKVWRLDDGTLLRTLKGHGGKKILSVSLSHDGKMLASGGEDNTVQIWQWNQNLDELMTKGCNWMRHYLKTNPNISQSDRHLCDGIGNAK